MVNINEIKIAGRIVEEAVDAAATAIHGSPTANRLLEASGGLHMPTVSTPNILGEKIGCLLTPDKIKGFAEDLFGKLDSHPSVHYDLKQNQLQLFLKADQMCIGAQASAEQIQLISAWFKANNLDTSPQAIARGLTVRGGRHLTDEAAEPAHANGDLAASFHPPRYILRSSSKVN